MERIYESMLIVRSDLADQERDSVFQKVLQKIEALQGKVTQSAIWSKERSFCFPIKSRGAEKKKYVRGCYWLLNFTLDTEKLSDLKETIWIEDRILRNIVIKKDSRKNSVLSFVNKGGGDG